MSFIQKLIRPNVRKMSGYVSARHLAQKAKIFLDANENALGSFLGKIEGVDPSRYPDPFADSLRSKLAKYLGAEPAKILVGNGSDEIIWLLLFAFVEKSENIVVMSPTFSMYQVAANLIGAQTKKVLLEEDYSLDPKKILKAVNKKTKLIFLCSPNNPTAQALHIPAIEEIAKKSKKIVVVDEAYIEFCPGKTALKLLKKYPNLVILRTFSKAWGLAGIRVGYGIASEEIIEVLAKVRAPYSADVLSTKLAEKALSMPNKMRTSVKKLLAEREKLTKQFWKLGLTVFPSDANFLLIKFPSSINAKKIYQMLVKKYGIVLRDFSSKTLLNNCVRVTVGNSIENKKLITSLKKLLK